MKTLILKKDNSVQQMDESETKFTESVNAYIVKNTERIAKIDAYENYEKALRLNMTCKQLRAVADNGITESQKAMDNLKKELDETLGSEATRYAFVDDIKKSFSTPLAKMALALLIPALIFWAFTKLQPVEAVVEVDAGTVAVVEEVSEPAVEKEEKVALTPDKVESIIRELADEHDFQWPDYLVRLAKCESGLRADAVNVHNNVPEDSIDRGVFQWNDYWQPQVSDECAFDLTCATLKAMEKINDGGQGIWVCDKYI